MTEYTRLIQDQLGNTCRITLIDNSYNTDINDNYISNANIDIIYTNLYSISGEKYILNNSFNSLTQMKNTNNETFTLYDESNQTIDLNVNN